MTTPITTQTASGWPKRFRELSQQYLNGGFFSQSAVTSKLMAGDFTPLDEMRKAPMERVEYHQAEAEMLRCRLRFQQLELTRQIAAAEANIKAARDDLALYDEVQQCFSTTSEDQPFTPTDLSDPVPSSDPTRAP